MSKSLNSPTARLLQTSRLFSLPRPLPQPALETVTSTGIYRSSDTATLPYPTHQAIVTPPSSHHRGDWGLKRPLPTKATRDSSNPTIRVSALDNAAHITDFGSAGNHVRTEAKWREMGVPLLHKENKMRYSSMRSTQSVYDEDLDNTDAEAVRLGCTNAPQSSSRGFPSAFAQSTRMKRWKFAGPWVKGMSQGEFELYLIKSVTSRKAEFREFLLERMLDRRVQDEERSLRDQGERRAVSRYRRSELRREILDNFEAEEKRLRDEHAVQHLGSELTAAICDFLDLPGIQNQELGVKTATRALSNMVPDYISDDAGPPSTHPAAGLSHIRSSAFMENHPLWGPQAQRTPVKARVLRPRNSAQGNESQAKLGVGGIVTNDPVGSTQRYDRGLGADVEDAEERYLEPNDMTNVIDPDLPGGNKIWVHPDSAQISEKGRILLHISRGDKEAIAVRRNKTEPIHEARSASLRGPIPGSSAFSGTATSANYGFGLPNKRAAQPEWRRSTIRGFDEELSRGPQRGKMNESETVTKIREMMGDRLARRT